MRMKQRNPGIRAIPLESVSDFIFRMNATLLLLAFIFLAATSVEAQQARQFTVSQKLELTQRVDGVDGSLLVLSDARLTSQLRKKMWGEGDWGFVISESDPLYKVFSANPPRNAILRLVDIHGHKLAEQKLERPIASVDHARLQDDKPTFLVTVDYSIGFGSYAGLTTLLLDVSNAEFHWLEAKNADTGEIGLIRLPKTLKSDWRFSPSGAQQDILYIACRPAANGDFVVVHARYHFDGHGWIRYEKTKNGFWESGDGPFPKLDRFP